MPKPFQKTINLYSIYRQLAPYTRPYRWLINGTLILTLLGALTAQVNPVVLKYTVDEVSKLIQTSCKYPFS